MYHDLYVFPTQGYTKVGYYRDSVGKESRIDDYVKTIYLRWVIGVYEKKEIENCFMGVLKFKPHVRGECCKSYFNFIHPESILEHE